MIHVETFTDMKKFEERLNLIHVRGRILSTNIGVDEDGWWGAVVYYAYDNSSSDR